MKLGEIKIQALKLMFLTYDRDIGISDLESLKIDENFRGYLINMNGSINRAFDRITMVGVLPLATKVFTENDGIKGQYRTKYALSAVKTESGLDCYRVSRVIYENGETYIGNRAFRMEGDKIVLSNLERGASYTILFYPRLEHILDTADDNKDVAIPNDIASLIPYFIKSELYEEDEPSVANMARNIFENGLNERILEQESNQNSVEVVYRCEE